jgi:hypothetical protein
VCDDECLIEGDDDTAHVNRFGVEGAEIASAQIAFRPRVRLSGEIVPVPGARACYCSTLERASVREIALRRARHPIQPRAATMTPSGSSGPMAAITLAMKAMKFRHD